VSLTAADDEDEELKAETRRMRLIARQHGTEVDPWEDLELTDWKAVEQFAQQFVRRLR
jgi:menaquinone-dependent protoporphyrinogen IX oxidase